MGCAVRRSRETSLRYKLVLLVSTLLITVQQLARSLPMGKQRFCCLFFSAPSPRSLLGVEKKKKKLGYCIVTTRYWNASLAAIKGEVSRGRRTLVTIQFGHNDQKIATPDSMGKNLTTMVRQIRSLGAEPVLVTSLTRRSFNSNGTVADTLGPWADGEFVPKVIPISWEMFKLKGSIVDRDKWHWLNPWCYPPPET